MGVLTATFGGIIRDVLADEPSVLLRREIYVTAALLGAAVFVGLHLLGVAPLMAGLAGFAAALALRAGPSCSAGRCRGFRAVRIRGHSPPRRHGRLHAGHPSR